MKTISTILREANEAKTEAQRLQILKDHASATLKQVLGMAFDPAVKWALPSGTRVPYTPSKDPKRDKLRLFTEARKLPYFVESPMTKNMNPFQRERLFLQVLENIEPNDAVMLCYVKDKKLTELYPNITYELVRTLYVNGIAAHWEPAQKKPKLEDFKIITDEEAEKIDKSVRVPAKKKKIIGRKKAVRKPKTTEEKTVKDETKPLTVEQKVVTNVETETAQERAMKAILGEVAQSNV